jgi:hypothetical protein
MTMAHLLRSAKPEGSITLLLALLACLAAHSPAHARPDRYERETEHFIVIYPERNADLVSHIAESAERAFSRLAPAFDYVPSEKIVIRTTDYSDYGSAGARTMPHNVIRLAVEPLEIAYEAQVFDDPIRGLIGHELVHIIVNDLSSDAERSGSPLTSKVVPDQGHPMSVFYSMLTRPHRYTPRWHQEGIAVFLETWLNGGYGRTLGSFDEMYFRSLALDRVPFATPEEVESEGTDISFLLGNLQYLYGARFVARLAETYGTDRVLRWYRSSGPGYRRAFEEVFGIDLETAWDDFAVAEQRFQERNIMAIASSPLTTPRRLRQASMGWVTQPYLDRSGARVLFGNHQSHRLTAVNRLDLESQTIERIGSLPTPSMTGLASTAFDAERGLFFYTTNNNALHRDVRVLDVESQRSRLIFENARVGQLAVSSATRELWGVRHSRGRATLVVSEFPYRRMRQVIRFGYGDTLQHLALSPSGRHLAATLHQATGRQAIVVADVERLEMTHRFQFQTLSEDGSPEFPSWSPDGTTLYWSAYTSGVSNLYRYRPEVGRVEAVSNTLRGLFRPVQVDSKTLFAFEFGPEGFTPVLVPNAPVERVPAIEYQGQAVLEKNPQLASWALTPEDDDGTPPAARLESEPYRGMAQLQVDSFMPVVSGFQDQVVVGLNARFTDPLSHHDLSFELGLSPFGDRRQVHVRALYELERKYRVSFEHNPSSFYDLFNQRSQGASGTKIGLGHTKRWKIDKPHSITQTSELAFHTGVESIHDNQVPVSTPRFFSFETRLHSRNVRRAIGSVDSERGTEWTATLNALGLEGRIVGGLHGDWNWYSTVERPHNVFHLQLAGGFATAPPDLAIGQFYLGGFGNQLLENEEVKQFRNPLRFPGVPVYSLPTGGFAKIMVEHNLPPLRVAGARIGSHALSHVDASWFVQGLMLDGRPKQIGHNLGAQVNLVFEHWSNLESTLSAGLARAWLPDRPSWEWFVSIKLLKN